MGEDAKKLAWKIASQRRREGVAVEVDSMGRSMKSQFKYADKLSVPAVLVLGEEEILSGKAKLRKMADGAEREYDLNRFVADYLAEYQKGK